MFADQPSSMTVGAMRSRDVIAPRAIGAVVRTAPRRGSHRAERLQLSDDELRNQVLNCLGKFSPGMSRAVRITVRHSDVTLRGAVSSDYERRVIEQAIGRVSGIGKLNNQIVVCPDHASCAGAVTIRLAPLDRLWSVVTTAIVVATRCFVSGSGKVCRMTRKLPR